MINGGRRCCPFVPLRAGPGEDGTGSAGCGDPPGDPGLLRGLASVFFLADDSPGPDIISPGAFQADLPRFLADGFVSGLNHDWDHPIGRPLEARETDMGLLVSCRLADTPAAREARVLIGAGVVRYLSIGFQALGQERLATRADVRAWWARHGYAPTERDEHLVRHGARLLTRIRLYEVSPVCVPANPGSVILDMHGGALRADALYSGFLEWESRHLGVPGSRDSSMRAAGVGVNNDD